MLVLDAGAFIAAERGTGDVAALVKNEFTSGRVPLTNGAVIAQIWRGGTGRQAKVALLLDNVEVVPVDDGLGKRAGMLQARTGAADAVDASVVCLAQDGDDILTSDPLDLLDLVRTAGVHVEVIPV
jgi:predicted nucleic acid-binding protein